MVLTLVAATVVLALSARPSSFAATGSDELSELVEALGDRDPAIRQRANDRLAELGLSARESLESAAQSEDPERARRAEELLDRLPWTAPDDSPDVNRILADYGRADVPARREALKRLVAIRAFESCLRILIREPSEPLRWWLAGQLMETNSPELMQRAQDWGQVDDAELERRGTPAIALVAWGWSKDSPDRANHFYSRVITLESQRPTVDETGLLERIYDFQINQALQDNHADEAAELLRKLIARAESQFAGASAVTRLFALHAYLGPLKQFASDLRLYGPALRRPRGTDAYLVLANQLGAPSARVAAMSGHLLSDVAPLERMTSAEALIRANLLDAAAHELRALLSTPMEDGPTRMIVELTASYRLAYIDGNAGRDRQAAEHLDRILAIEKKSDYRIREGEEIEAQAAWRRLRAARTENKPAEMQTELDHLLELSPSHADIALDVVPLLKSQRRDKEAERFFERAYRQLKYRADRDHGNAEAANNLAWLCARSGMNLQEALDLANRAITLAPDNPAYLDTAAEAHFALGNIDQAIKLETRALKSRPNDAFMQEQLERFKAAQQ